MHFHRITSTFSRGVLRISALLLSAAAIVPGQPDVTYSTFPVPAIVGMNNLTVGPDGALWIAARYGVWRMTTTGAVTQYALPDAAIFDRGAEDITVGPDGALWFTEYPGPKLGRITMGGAITEYTLPESGWYATSISTGPDGALWLTEFNGLDGRIGRMTTTGAVTEYPLPPCQSTGGVHCAGFLPMHIVAGPDGAMWFANGIEGRIYRITTAGVLTGFNHSLFGQTNVPGDIIVGPDRALWFTDSDTGGPNDKMGRMTLDGVTTLFSLPIYRRPTYNGYNNLAPNSLTLGPDGAFWFVSSRVSLIGRLTSGGQMTLYRLPPGGHADEVGALRNIVLGPDGALWVTDEPNIVRVVPVADATPPVITPKISGTPASNGWYRSNVIVRWSVSDDKSGIKSSSGCDQANINIETSGLTLTCSATNGAGLSNSVSVTIKIDRTRPVLSEMPSPGCTLSPANGQLAKVADVRATDRYSGIAPGSFKVTGTSNEPASGGNPDIVITPNGTSGFAVWLRAARSPDGNGRIYKVTATANDVAGNEAKATATCVVPR